MSRIEELTAKLETACGTEKAELLNELGLLVHWNRKEHDKALSYMEKSLESHFAAHKIRAELGDIASVYMAGILCGIGEAYKCLKMHNQAVEYYDQAYKIGQRIGYKEIMIVADSDAGDAYIQSNRPELALRRLKRAYRLSREIGLRPRELASCCLIATSYEKLGRHKDALRYHKIYANLQGALFDEQKNRQIAEMQARFESEQSRKEAEIYRLKNVDLLREITERKRAEDELTKYKDHLEELVKERTAELEKALEEVERLKNQLQAENIYLQEEIRLEHNFEEIIGRSEKLNRVLLRVERVASTNSTVLITGETGTGDLQYNIDIFETPSGLRRSGGYEPIPFAATAGSHPPVPASTLQGGDNVSDATVIPSLPFSDAGTTSGYTNDYSGSCGIDEGTPDVVYSYSLSDPVTVKISLCGGPRWNTRLYVYENDTRTEIACNDDACGSQWEVTGVLFRSRSTYYIVMDGSGTESGDYTISITEDNTSANWIVPAGPRPKANPIADPIMWVITTAAVIPPPRHSSLSTAA